MREWTPYLSPGIDEIFSVSQSGPADSCGEILGRGVSSEAQQEILALHNDLRRRVARGEEDQLAGLTASDMMELTWDTELARGAQLWADQCVFQHDNNDVCRSILLLFKYFNCKIVPWPKYFSYGHTD